MAHARKKQGTENAAQDFAARFGALIRERRDALKMRQDDLALATGLGRRFILELEAGKPSCHLGRRSSSRPRSACDRRSDGRQQRRTTPCCPTCRDSRTRGRRPWLSSRSTTRPAASARSRCTPTARPSSTTPNGCGARRLPLSILMPLSPRRVPPQLFVPWAANLLPEASQLRTVGRRLGAAPEDVIGILAEIGRDTAGALSIGKPGSADPARLAAGTERRRAGAHPR